MARNSSHGFMTPFEVQQRGMAALIHELGYAGAVRFMLQFRRGKGNYTKERRTLLAGVSVEDALKAVDEVVSRAKTRSRRRRSA